MQEASIDVARTEAVEAELTRMIEKRADNKPDPDEQEELWKESVRRHHAARREENRALWIGYFERLAWSLRARAEEYDARALKLLEEDEQS